MIVSKSIFQEKPLQVNMVMNMAPGMESLLKHSFFLSMFTENMAQLGGPILVNLMWKEILKRCSGSMADTLKRRCRLLKILSPPGHPIPLNMILKPSRNTREWELKSGYMVQCYMKVRSTVGWEAPPFLIFLLSMIVLSAGVAGNTGHSPG